MAQNQLKLYEVAVTYALTTHRDAKIQILALDEQTAITQLRERLQAEGIFTCLNHHVSSPDYQVKVIDAAPQVIIPTPQTLKHAITKTQGGILIRLHRLRKRNCKIVFANNHHNRVYWTFSIPLKTSRHLNHIGYNTILSMVRKNLLISSPIQNEVEWRIQLAVGTYAVTRATLELNMANQKVLKFTQILDQKGYHPLVSESITDILSQK